MHLFSYPHRFFLRQLLTEATNRTTCKRQSKDYGYLRTIHLIRKYTHDWSHSKQTENSRGIVIKKAPSRPLSNCFAKNRCCRDKNRIKMVHFKKKLIAFMWIDVYAEMYLTSLIRRMFQWLDVRHVPWIPFAPQRSNSILVRFTITDWILKPYTNTIMPPSWEWKNNTDCSVTWKAVVENLSTAHCSVISVEAGIVMALVNRIPSPTAIVGVTRQLNPSNEDAALCACPIDEKQANFIYFVGPVLSGIPFQADMNYNAFWYRAVILSTMLNELQRRK